MCANAIITPAVSSTWETTQAVWQMSSTAWCCRLQATARRLLLNNAKNYPEHSQISTFNRLTGEMQAANLILQQLKSLLKQILTSRNMLKTMRPSMEQVLRMQHKNKIQIYRWTMQTTASLRAIIPFGNESVRYFRGNINRNKELNFWL